MAVVESFRKIALCLAACAVVIGAPRDASACSCAPSTVMTSYHLADAVFVGRVMFKAAIGFDTWYAVRVRTPLKGCPAKGSWAYLKTGNFGAGCGVNLKKGQTYLLHGFDTGSTWKVPVFSVNSCSTNKQVSKLTKSERKWLLERTVCCGGGCTCVDGTFPVNCFVDPCEVNSCPVGECTANYCGGCNAEFYDNWGNPMCNPCQTDSDCTMGFWCQPTQNSSLKKCVPYQQEGESCGGFTPIWAQAKCSPDLECTDTPEFIADAPGKCRKPCDITLNCPPAQYCSVTGHCRDDSTCWKDKDCTVPGNSWDVDGCAGTEFCGPKKTCMVACE